MQSEKKLFIENDIFMQAERKIVEFMFPSLNTKLANIFVFTHFLSVQQQSLVLMALLEVEFLKCDEE